MIGWNIKVHKYFLIIWDGGSCVDLDIYTSLHVFYVLEVWWYWYLNSIVHTVGWDSFYLGGCTKRKYTIFWRLFDSRRKENMDWRFTCRRFKMWTMLELLTSSWFISWSPHTLQTLLWCYCWSTTLPLLAALSWYVCVWRY